MSIKLIIAAVFYLISLFCLTIYSYSQIDLNLTLSSNSVYQSVQKQLIQLGYFNRPLSSSLFLLILIFMVLFSITMLYYVRKVKIKKRYFIIFAGTIITLSFLSYPSFSHDIFNYIFDARIVTKYHVNPYFYKALDFTSDPWIRFMHWTHRTFPYGPVWLFATIPFSYLGFGKFVLTLFSFKVFFALLYVGNIYFISEILKITKPKERAFGTVFFAVNPLIIIETLISPHNESLVLFFLLLAVYFMVDKKNTLLSIFSILLSAGVKYTTGVLFPIFALRKSLVLKIGYEKTLILCLGILFLPIIIQIYYREPYPWYFVPVIGIASLLPNRKNLSNYVYAFSTGLLLRYFPFLNTGEYSNRNMTTGLFFMFIPPAILFFNDIIRIIIKSRFKDL